MRCFKVSPMTFQSHPFYRAIWVILGGEMAGITVQNGQDWNTRYKLLIINRSELRSIRMHVGTHGSCVRSNASVYLPSIPLARTHGPCVPTCLAACNSFPSPLVYLSTTRCGRTGRASLHRYHGRIAGQRLFGVRARCRRLIAKMLFVALRKIGGRGEAYFIRDL